MRNDKGFNSTLGYSLLLCMALLLLSCGGGRGGNGGGEDPGPGTENQAPTANAGPDQSADAGALVVLNGNGSDTDGSIAAYQWIELSTVGIQLIDADLASARFRAPITFEPLSLEFQLSVTDDDGATATDSVLVSVNPAANSTNQAPRAQAGYDQTLNLGDTAYLDAQYSSDSDGDPLVFQWAFLSRPNESSAMLSEAMQLRPAFQLDQPGEYLLQLTVSDDFVSTQDQVIVSTTNSAPVAEAGLDKRIALDEMVTLDGSGSSDVDGDSLVFSWSLDSRPENSLATLSNDNQINPSFVVDEDGEYILRLIVNDGLQNSEPDRIRLSTENLPPTADAGPDQTAIVSEIVQLDASASFDADLDALAYQWALIGLPQNSEAALDDPTSPSPQFQIDLAGDYLVQLIVNDGFQDSQPDQLVISTDNSAPIAKAGEDQTLELGAVVLLDGSAATDADADPLSYRWALLSKPVGSSAAIDQASSESPNFTADTVGIYIAQLIVNDGMRNSSPDTVKVVVTEPEPNFPPVIQSSPGSEAQIDQTYLYQLQVIDPDNDPIAFDLIEAPLGMTLSQEGTLSWTPVNGGNASVSLSVSDGINTPVGQSFTLSVKGLDENEPVLSDIGNQIAVLGQTLSLALNATDPNGDALRFSATPLPLPANLSLDAVSGLLEFTPDGDQVGNFSLTLRVSDGRFSDQETIQIHVPEPEGVTQLSGRVLTLGNAPLAGVRLEAGGVETLSDADGNFLLDNLPVAGRVRVLFDGSTVDPELGTFATVPEMIQIIEGTKNYLTPEVFLLPLDIASADPVDPTTTSTITSSRFTDGLSISEPVTLTIPPGAAINDETGEPFEGNIHISRVEDPAMGPRPLPEGLGLGVYIAIQPFGVTYPDPVPISFPNLEGFPPGSRLDFFALNHETGHMEKIGEGLVSADGKTVDSIGGIVKSNSWHGIVPQQPQASPSQPPDQSEPVRPPESDDPVGKPDCPKRGGGDCAGSNKECDACSFDKQTGNLGEYHSLPTYSSLGENRHLRLEYNSNLANPKPIIPMVSGFGNRAPPPLSMSMEIVIAGVAQNEKKYSQVKVEPSSIRGQFKTTRPAIQFDGSALSTGIYDFDVTIECQFPISFRADTVPGQVIVDNRSDSEFGAGWSIAGLQSLYEHADGSILLITGTSSSLVFRPDQLVEGAFTSPPGDYTSLSKLDSGQYLRRMRSGVEYLFSTDGKQLSKTDRNGNVTRYEYDFDERISRIVDPVGKSFEFAYASGRLNKITDPLGRVTQFQHDAEGNLTEIIEPNGDVRAFEYAQGSHLMRAQLDQRGNRKEYFYDFAGRIKEALLPDGNRVQVEVADVKGLLPPDLEASRDNPAPAPLLEEEVNNQFIDLNGNKTLTESDNRNMPIKFTDAIGRVTQHDRDQNSHPIKTRRANNSVITRKFDALGRKTQTVEQFNGAMRQYAYDAFGLMTQYINPNQHQTQITRDQFGNVDAVTNHRGHTTTMEQDTRGLVTNIITPNGLEIDYQYNEAGLVESIVETPPDGSPGSTRTTRFEYDAAGQTTKILTPDNIELSFVYDPKGRLIKTTDNLNQSIEYSYDAFNNLIKSDTRNSGGSIALTVQRAFDERNRAIESKAPHSGEQLSIQQYKFDANSNLIELIDPKGKRSINLYDAEDRLIQNTHRLDGVTTYEYDTNNRITKVVAANGVETQYSYDVLGRRLTEVSADRGTLAYEYDQANNIIAVTDGRGIQAQLEYDELERIISKTYPNTIAGKSEDITYEYDDCSFGIGRLCALTDESGRYDYSYDAFGNLTRVSHTELGVTYTTAYQYDAGDNLSQITYPTGRVVTYQRDALRRIEQVSATVNSSTKTLLSDIRYRADNRMTQGTFGNGLLDQREYDLQGRLIDQSLSASNPLDERSYRYDLNSNMVSRATTPQTSEYEYDALDRMVGDKIDDANPFEYEYDLNHNRLSKNQASEASIGLDEIYEIEANSNRLLRRSQVTEANLDPKPFEQQRIYNNANRLFQLIDDGKLKAEYIYNAQGQRTRKTVFDPEGNATARIYHYDLTGNLIAETDESGNSTREYVWLNGQTAVAQIDVVGTSETLTYLHTDHLMTPRIGTDASQQVVWRWEGEAFGNTEDQSSGVKVNLRFPGQYYDKETELHYNWNRFYDAELGRYAESDSIGLNGGVNTFSYVLGNPVSMIDPLGLAAGDWWDVPANLQRGREIGTELFKNNPNLQGHNDLSDAYRHAEWSRRMTEELGSGWSNVIGTGHEVWDNAIKEQLYQGKPLNVDELRMDLHNNAVGREAGRNGTSIQQDDLKSLTPLNTDELNGSCPVIR